MVRVRDIDESIHFYGDILGMKEIRRIESEKGRYTNVFLSAPKDVERAEQEQTPLLELTYNWPDENGKGEEYTGGRNFGHLAFAVDNIYDFCARVMESKVVINRPPRDGRMAFIKSPDGISIELLQSDEALAPEEPWVSMENIGSW